jgi:hypothetical protein
MRAPMRLSLIAVVAVTAVGCGGGRRATELRTSEFPVGERWNANLGAPAAMVGVVQVGGHAWMASGADSAETRAYIEISNAIPGGRYPWHIHQGQCGSARDILGPADSYGILQVGKDGRASRSVTLPAAMPRTGSYMVDVHAASNNLRTIISCGNLAPPVR